MKNLIRSVSCSLLGREAARASWAVFPQRLWITQDQSFSAQLSVPHLDLHSGAFIRAAHALTIGWSDRGLRLRSAKRRVDDWDKSASLVVGATPRRSTSSLDDSFVTSSFDMSYVFALGGSAFFLACAGVVAVCSFLFAPLRRIRPYAWRVWLWGGIGSFAGTVIFLAAIAYPLMHIGVAGGGGESTVNQDMIFIAAIAFGPIVSSVLGTLVGAFYGFYLARRKVRLSADV
jgi:hypothetical protein